MADDVSASLWAAIDSGRIDTLVPELPALRMEQDPIHRHKDVLSHTVASSPRPRPTSRSPGALFHDIAKPKTRSFEHGGVTFRHHEVVGGRMTSKRMACARLRRVGDRPGCRAGRLSGRFKGYADGWSDAAVRRYARDAGPLLGRLNALVRSDCTTRNRAKAEALKESSTTSSADRRACGRGSPECRAAPDRRRCRDGPPRHRSGREIGQIMRWLLELKRSEGELPEAELSLVSRRTTLISSEPARCQR